MIVEMRTYTLRPSGAGEFLSTYRKMAWPLQRKHLGRCLGWYTALEGSGLNQVIHMWAFDSQADREARYAGLVVDPAWRDYLKTSGEQGHLLAADNRLLSPTRFFAELDGKTE